MRKLPGLSLLRLSGCMIVLTAVSGCVLDFEQFPTDPSVAPQNDVGSSDQGGDSASTDAGGDADNDASPDAGPTIVELGSACVDDTGCGLDKVCRSGFCTVLCDATTPCAEGVCAASEGAFVCAASCDAQCAVNSTLG